MNVTARVLPVMREQRSEGRHDLVDRRHRRQEFCSAYAASKFGLRDGWSRCGSRSSRTESDHDRRAGLLPHKTLLEKESTSYAELSIDDYAERTAQNRPAWEAMSGKQGGDPAKLAKALITIVDEEQPPLRWVAGADAVATVEQKANELLAQVDAYRDLSSSLAID
jgi:hypothetical protein